MAALASFVFSRDLGVIPAEKRARLYQSPAPSGLHALAAAKASNSFLTRNVFSAKITRGRCRHHHLLPAPWKFQRLHSPQSTKTLTDSGTLIFQWPSQLTLELMVHPMGFLIKIHTNLMSHSVEIQKIMWVSYLSFMQTWTQRSGPKLCRIYVNNLLMKRSATMKIPIPMLITPLKGIKTWGAYQSPKFVGLMVRLTQNSHRFWLMWWYI